ncbi:unnamed protein product [Mytilus coruscus]|uniref:Uncharacterized protein n=1 Tax=Mytilus coruscus TaxID=42192 RepID=A0A6J8DHE7_MYTCO|nr:unnamed protein product [Mytilus coruscus]
MYISKQPITSENNIVLHESKSNDCDNYEEDNKIYTESKNYVDYSTLTIDLQYDEMVQPIDTKVTDNDTAIFRGVVRKRTKRIVLYNVIADKPYELVSSAVRTYAEQKDVHITFTKLLKKRESRVGTFRPYLKPYWKNQNRNNSHFEQRNARRKWINNNKTREKTDLSYVEYKNKKREFRKRKRIAENLWQEEKFEDIKLAAEMDIGEFYQRVRRMRKSGPSTTKLSYNGTEATTDSSICELWGEYFRDLYSEQPTECFNETFSMKFRRKCKHTLKIVIKHLFQNLKNKLF